MMDRKILIDNEKNFYKGNLHCHSTFSDGKQTPEELKKAYKEKGYSFVAFTDHEILYEHSYLDDDSFIAITGTEYAIKEFSDQSTLKNFNMKVCHLNLYAKEQKNTFPVCYNGVYDHFSKKEKHDEMVEKYGNYNRVYGKKGINEIIRLANENGFFVCYNHPRWSLENYSDYIEYEGLWGVEVYNTSSERVGIYEYNINALDDFLRSGKKIFASSGDDNHNKDSCFGTFVMVNAEKLSYESIINALLNGDFYTSQKPLIYELYVCDKKAVLKCSNAKIISYSTCGRRSEAVCADEDNYINEAEFEIEDTDIYFRISITDENGNRANTQAYFLADLK